MRGGPWIALVLVLALAAAGCAAPEPTGGAAPDAPADAAEPRTDSGVDVDADVIMLGRSVMRGWFDHWGANGGAQVAREGFTLRYVEIAGPPELGTSAAAAIAEAPTGSIVLFKPCFVDFWATAPGDVETNVAELVGYANEVVAAAEARGVRLILGTAIPRVPAETDPSLVEAHRRYGEEMARLAEENDGVVVFDLNGALAGPDGALRDGYALAPGDSHLSSAAYDALDARFFTLLRDVRQRP